MQLARNFINVAAQNGRKIGVHNSRISAPDQFYERACFMARRDLREAHLAGNLRYTGLVIREVVGMNKDNGDGANAILICALQCIPGNIFIKRCLYCSIGVHTFGNFLDSVV